MQSFPTPADVSSNLSQNVFELFKELGCKVYIRHSRYYLVPDLEEKKYIVGPFTRKKAEDLGYKGVNIYGRGGFTDVEIYKDGKLLFQGSSRCSMKDQFVRKYGRQVALCRALSKNTVDHIDGCV